MLLLVEGGIENTNMMSKHYIFINKYMMFSQATLPSREPDYSTMSLYMKSPETISVREKTQDYVTFTAPNSRISFGTVSTPTLRTIFWPVIDSIVPHIVNRNCGFFLGRWS